MRAVNLKTTKGLQKVICQELPRWIEENPTLRRRLREALRQAPAQTEGTPAPQSPMTYEEFLDWAGEDTLAEWVNGRVVMYSPASKQHQSIADFLARVVGTFAEQHDLGTVLSAPFQMKLEHSGREPDLLFVAKDHLDRLQETYLDGPADLAVEIVSPESAGRDRGNKFYEYAEGGVPEYWLIDPLHKRAEFYRLNDDGRYDTVLEGHEGVYRSAVVQDFWLRVEWLWQEPMPKTLDVLRELDVL